MKAYRWVRKNLILAESDCDDEREKESLLRQVKKGFNW